MFIMSGYKINPDRNIPWNDLPDLPLPASLYKDIDVFEQLGKSKEALGKLQGRSIAIPNQGILVNSISLQEAKASSAIENIFTTDDELYQAFSETANDALSISAKEVLQYREALWNGYSIIRQQPTFDTNYMITIYQVVKEANDGFRSEYLPTVIKQGGSGPNAGTTIYTPPRGKGVIEQKMDNLMAFLNSQTDGIDPLLKMAIAHFQFEAIHPFSDGNGRTGRIINIHYLVACGLLDFPILFLSGYINQHKNDYYATLAGVSQRGDWKNWLLLMLKAVEVTSKNTYHKINNILAAMEAIQLEMEKSKFFRRPEQLTQTIFTQPMTKVKHLVDANAYAENTARNYLNRLSDMGILEKRTIGGHHYYVNTALYNILADSYLA